MAEIKLNAEILSALQGCKNAKDVVALAKSRGIEVTEEKAEKILGFVQNDKLSDEDLDKVVGGNCSPMYPWEEQTQVRIDHAVVPWYLKG